MRGYVISLNSSLERRENVMAQLGSFEFSFFDAVDFSKDEHQFIFNFYDDNRCRKWKGRSLSKGELGCFASHALLWRECVGLNEPIFIFEDNFEVTDKFHSHIEYIKENVAEFGIIKMQNTQKKKYLLVKSITRDFSIIKLLGNGCGTGSYAISPVVANKLLEKMNGFFEPVDDFMESEWVVNQPIYSCHPPLTFRSKVASVIGIRRSKARLGLGNKILVELYRGYRRLMRKVYNVSYILRRRFSDI